MLYRAEDISLSEDFTSDVVNLALFDKEEFIVGNLERFGGLYEHGFRKYFRSPLNIMKVQPGIAKFFRPPCLAFVPAEETLRDIFDFYKANTHCDMEECQRFDEVPHLQTSTYFLGVDPCFQKDLFTRHPLTGKILRHRHPYTTLPKFTLPVHPCIAALRAGYLISFSPDETPISKTLLDISRYHVRSRRDVPPRRCLPKPCPRHLALLHPPPWSALHRRRALPSRQNPRTRLARQAKFPSGPRSASWRLASLLSLRVWLKSNGARADHLWQIPLQPSEPFFRRRRNREDDLRGIVKA